MKIRTRIILVMCAVIVTGLTVATSGWSISYPAEASAPCCCCSGESCPMKKKDVSAREMAATDEKGVCCKDGACPMKKKAPSAKEAAMSCDTCDCCNADSCPMKNGERVGMAQREMKDPKKQNERVMACCPCCNKHKEGPKPSVAIIDLVSH